MSRRALLTLGVFGALLQSTAWAQSGSPALSADEIAKALKPGIDLTAAPSDVLSANELAAILKPSAVGGATRSLAAGTGTAKAGQTGSGVVNLQINFATNSAKISPQARDQLDELGRALQLPQLQDLRFEIAGHTDARGSAKANKTLSQKRAEAVVGYLVTEYSITQGRLEPVGYGEDLLFDPVNPASGKNRRVEVRAE